MNGWCNCQGHFFLGLTCIDVYTLEILEWKGEVSKVEKDMFGCVQIFLAVQIPGGIIICTKYCGFIRPE